MTTLKCIIVEDEPLAQRILEKYIEDHDQLILTRTCNNAFYAFSIINEQPIDVMFLDIKMPLVNGLDFLKTLNNPPKVILTTAFSEYGALSYELNVTDYLLKPFTFERFKKSINKLLRVEELKSINFELDYIFVKVESRLVKINHIDILYIEAMGDYLKVFTAEKVYITHMTMKSIEELLPITKFIRVQRSYIVALSKITSTGRKCIEINKIKIPVGDLYRKKLKYLPGQHIHSPAIPGY